jgi:hypothetical protein
MMRGYIEELKAILAKMEAKWAALEADVGVAPKDDTAPADPMVAPPVETPVADGPPASDAPVDDGSAANEPVPDAPAEESPAPAQDDTTVQL